MVPLHHAAPMILGWDLLLLHKAFKTRNVATTTIGAEIQIRKGTGLGGEGLTFFLQHIKNCVNKLGF